MLKSVFSFLFFTLLAIHPSCFTHIAYARTNNIQEYSIEFKNEIKQEDAQFLTRLLLKRKIIDSLLILPEIERILSLTHFNTQQSIALIEKSIHINFLDNINKNIHTNPQNSENYTYTAQAYLETKNIVSEIQKNLKQEFLIFRLAEVEEDTISRISSIEDLLQDKDLNTSYQDLEHEIDYLQALEEIRKILKLYYTDTWTELDAVKSILEKYTSLAPISLSLTNCLAELYIQLDRPQNALNTIEQLQISKNVFTKYLEVVTSLRLGHIYLAEEDIKKMLTEIANTHALYPYCLVLAGTIAQVQEKTQDMCKTYKEACLYNICAPYFAVQQSCGF